MQTRTGGAIRPHRYLRAWPMPLIPRPVQVWVDRESNQSVIVELLELDEGCDDHEAAERIFRDCAQVSRARRAVLFWF